MDKQKQGVVDTYTRLGCAQADVLLEIHRRVSAETKMAGQTEQTEGTSESLPTLPAVTVKELDDTLSNLQKWTDVTDPKVTLPNHNLTHVIIKCHAAMNILIIGPFPNLYIHCSRYMYF